MNTFSPHSFMIRYRTRLSHFAVSILNFMLTSDILTNKLLSAQDASFAYLDELLELRETDLETDRDRDLDFDLEDDDDLDEAPGDRFLDSLMSPLVVSAVDDEALFRGRVGVTHSEVEGSVGA